MPFFDDTFLLDEQQHGSSSSSSRCDDFESCRSYRLQLVEATNELWNMVTSLSPPRADDSPLGGSGRIAWWAASGSDLRTALLRTGANRNVRIDRGTRLFVIERRKPNQKDRFARLQRLEGVLEMLHNTRLHGTIIWVLGGGGDNNSTSTDTSMIQDSTVGNSIVHVSGVRITNSVVLNAYVGQHTRIESSRIGFGGRTDEQAEGGPPSERLTIHVGAESGGKRELVLDASCTMVDVSDQLVAGISAGAGSTRRDDPSNNPPAIGGVTNYVGQCCRVMDTNRVDRIFLYPHASLESAFQVSNVTLLPHASISNGCVVKDCLLQWNCHITDLSTVHDSVLMEASHVGPHSTIAHSVLGPDVHVSNGEIHASVLGPNTNSHHQSLVISAIWLCGRGNVGYGANVGSNHTGRLPDQEVCVNEGVFFGLSCVVKFPVSLAPYTLVSAGTQLSPQRMTMPFSLIANDQLLPGWVLSSSPYTIVRAEIKVSTRRNAKRHDYASWPVLRPWTIQQCVLSRLALMSISTSNDGTTSTFTEKSIRGVGACVVADKARMAGITAYTNCIQRYALRGLLDQLSDALGRSDSNDAPMEDVIRSLRLAEASPLPPHLDAVHDDDRNVPWEVFPWHEDMSTVWEYQRHLLQLEFGSVLQTDASLDVSHWLSRLLTRFLELDADHTRRVLECKRRDDVRGSQTIPGYAATHVAAAKDPVVVHVQTVAAEAAERVQQILNRLRGGTSSMLGAESKL